MLLKKSRRIVSGHVPLPHIIRINKPVKEAGLYFLLEGSRIASRRVTSHPIIFEKSEVLLLGRLSTVDETSFMYKNCLPWNYKRKYEGK